MHFTNFVSYFTFSAEIMNKPEPPTSEFVKEARTKLEKERKMAQVLLDLVLYCFYMLLIVMVAYGQQNKDDSYFLNKHIKDVLWTDNFDQVCGTINI